LWELEELLEQKRDTFRAVKGIDRKTVYNDVNTIARPAKIDYSID